MKKLILLMLVLISSITLVAVWEVGEPLTQDYSWTDNYGEEHSIFELTESGKAILIFWGGET